MANLQELMQAVLDPSIRTRTPGLFGAWVTPNGGASVYVPIRARDAGHARLLVSTAARAEFPQGFTFSVRPV